MDAVDRSMRAVQEWASAFNAAVLDGDRQALARLIVADGYWRDVLALTWEIGWVHDAVAIANRFVEGAHDTQAVGFAVSSRYSPPKQAIRSGREVTEAFLDFTTRYGRGVAVVRLVEDPGSPGGLRAWTMLTALQELHGLEWPQPPQRRIPGAGFERSDPRRNWLDSRIEAAAYQQREPQVLIVGGGHSGAFLAAYLRQLHVDTLVVDRLPRAGDNWRTRYHSLVLHNPADAVQFPFIPYPTTFPEYIPKDMLGDWLQSYVVNMELNYWSSTEFLGGSYDKNSRRWDVSLRLGDGSERRMHPEHIVIATGGEGGTPRIPHYPGLETFAGDARHSKYYESGRAYTGQDVLVVGVSTSAHDVALDLYHHGARVTMLQRKPTVVVSLDSANLPFGYYRDGTPLEEADLCGAANFILPLFTESLRQLTKRTTELDRELLTGLERAGMRLDEGEDGAGWLMKFFRYRGGYYINVGASEVIIEGGIGLLQSDRITRFVPEGVELVDGSVRRFDAIVFATGYGNVQDEVRRFFGDEVADLVGEVGGFDERHELRNLYCRTPHEALWFNTGGIPTVRSYSRYLAIQLRAAIEGWLPDRRKQEVGASSE